MIIARSTEATSFENSPYCSGRSYGGTGSDIDGAIISVNGRYPESGFLVNEVSKELVYVTAGSGELIHRTGSKKFSKGDVIFIDNREEFAWDGEFEGFFATTPQFDPAQHKEIV